MHKLKICIPFVDLQSLLEPYLQFRGAARGLGHFAVGSDDLVCRSGILV